LIIFRYLKFLKKELKLKDENHEEQLRMKDEIIFKLEKENNCLRNESKDTIKSFFDKEEKLVDTLQAELKSVVEDEEVNELQFVCNILTSVK
jgi:predicted translin family RNA/ssDNA-binding protein